MGDLLARVASVRSTSLLRDEVYELLMAMCGPPLGLKNRFPCRIGGLLDTYIVIQPMGDSQLGIVPVWTSIHSITILYQELMQMISECSPPMALDVFGEKFASMMYICLCFILGSSRADSRPR